MLEEYPEPEITEDEANSESEDEDDENSEPLTLEDKLELADEKIADLRNGLLKAKEKLTGLDDELEALNIKNKAEEKIAKENRTGTVKEFTAEYKPTKQKNADKLKVTSKN